MKTPDLLTAEPIAHLASEPSLRAHLLIDHLREVSRIAREFGVRIGTPEASALAGLWHDVGKYSGAFQTMIRRANGFEAHIEGPDASGPRDHSTAGALLALERPDLSGNLKVALAFVIAGHHAGLGCMTELQRRREKVQLLEAARRGGLPAAVAGQTTAALPPWLLEAKTDDDRRRSELWIRMLFSTLCDADFLDTEAFYDSERSKLRGGWPSLESLHPKLIEHIEFLEKGADPTSVNAIRAEVRRACVASATLPPGFFTLTVPTGGGKTLAGMDFALAHARAHRLDRVIVAIPYTSIIEQNADVYRAALGADAVLEHHSALDPADPARETPRTRIASENWDAPIVVTTTVQLFESLLANRTSRCRKLHRIARSVVLLDEAQMLPVGLLHPTLDVLKGLVRDYGTSVVFSTATQPAFRRRPNLKFGIDGVREIAPNPAGLFERLKRVEVRWPPDCTAKISWDQLADEIAQEKDVLAIVHKRSDARQLTELLDARLGDTSTVHLSALMCPAHRSEVLERIKQMRKRGLSTRVVATQLIEAGVDVDFPVVYRALAGMDSIAQAAGRCNREGRQERGSLRVFVAPSDPPPGVLRTALGVTQGLLASNTHPSIDSPATFDAFFNQLYESRDTDNKGIQASRRELDFRRVAENYRLVEDEWSAPIIVGWGNAPKALNALRFGGASRAAYRALQRFTVNVQRKLQEQWLARGFAAEIEGVVALVPDSDSYSERFGLLVDRVGLHRADTLVVDG